MAKASSEFHSNKGGLAALSDLEKAVNKQESLAEAYEDLAATSAPAGQALLEKYSVGDASVEAELQELKRGMLAGGAPTPSLPHKP
ncbi:MAG: hypothetical protein EBS01_13615 [Verrucomicrobia bacterium]|nr:hypothetical protein [Verrucomicrobiota bacterium]